jgi:hypothetical protein
MKKHSASRAPTRAESGIYRSTPLSNSRNSRHKHRVYPPYTPSTKATIGIHPNTPISVRDLSPDRYHSAPSSRGTSRTSPTSASSRSSRDDDLESVTSEEATAYYEGFRQSQRAAEDAEYAQRLEKEERRRKEELDRQFAEARRLADEWTREETARLQAQARLAERLEREEREAAERIRRNREAARRAQEQWEAAAIARETEVMRAEERRRRDEIEERRVGDEQRRLRIERERGWAQEISERNRLIVEEKRRREQQNIAEGLRRQAQANNKRRDAGPPKQVDCVSCMEPGDERDMAVIPCDHAYCGECIKGMYCSFPKFIPAQLEHLFSYIVRNSFSTSSSSAVKLANFNPGAFKSAYKSRTPFKCCSITVPTYTVQRHLSQSFITKYNLMVLELSTPKPKYCSSLSCNKFIPPNKIKGPIATCPSCRTRTCVSCLKKEHSGVCAEDKEGKAVEALAKRKGWKQCPQCSWILERTQGCLHMTCKCGAEWCYSCLREWRVCNSTCGRR